MRNYKNIAAFKRADELTIQIYAKTKSFPREEIFGLTHQIRKASYSVAANIVEGSARESKREYLHFLYISRGSLAETEYFLHLSHQLGYLSDANFDSLSFQCNKTFAALAGLIKSVEREASLVSKVIALLTSGLVLYAIKNLSWT